MSRQRVIISVKYLYADATLEVIKIVNELLFFVCAELQLCRRSSGELVFDGLLLKYYKRVGHISQ